MLKNEVSHIFDSPHFFTPQSQAIAPLKQGSNALTTETLLIYSIVVVLPCLRGGGT